MQLRLKMIDRSDYTIAVLAMALGLGAQQAMAAIWLALPQWAQTVSQGLVTLALGLGALTAQHFWRRYLNRRWPDRKRVKEPEAEES